MATVTLRLAPRRAHVRTARLVASAMARRGGVPEDMLDDVRLAVGEACARAVRLHERHGVPDAVTLDLSDDDSFAVVVTDRVAERPGPGAGAGSDAVTRPPGAADQGHGGFGGFEGYESERLGLAVLTGVVDDLRVDRGPDGTRVYMRWPTRATG